jgi:hypothetical protein
MQTREALVRGGAFFQLLNESAQPRLFRFSYDEEFHTDSLRPAPTHSGILDLERDCLAWEVQEQRHLHSGEWRDQAFDTATLCGKVTDGPFVSKLVALNQDARHAHMETPVLASYHSRLLSCCLRRRLVQIQGPSRSCNPPCPGCIRIPCPRNLQQIAREIRRRIVHVGAGSYHCAPVDAKIPLT